MKSHSRAGTALVLLLIAQVSLSCLPRVLVPCSVPPQLHREDLTGTWQLSYQNYISPDLPSADSITGIETLVLAPEGMYTQRFESTAYSYTGEPREWSLVVDAPEGPRIVVKDFKYFAHGIKQSDASLVLGPQMIDLLRYKQTDGGRGDIFVDYPEERLVYLYPRICNGSLVLMQMVAGIRDPDDLASHHPAFQKTSPR